IVAMMMAPIVVTRVIRVGAVTTVVVRSPPAPAVVTADPTYLLHVLSAVCRDWCDRHCRRCGRCNAATYHHGRTKQLDFTHAHASLNVPLTRNTGGRFRCIWSIS